MFVNHKLYKIKDINFVRFEKKTWQKYYRNLCVYTKTNLVKYKCYQAYNKYIYILCNHLVRMKYAYVLLVLQYANINGEKYAPVYYLYKD